MTYIASKSITFDQPSLKMNQNKLRRTPVKPKCYQVNGHNFCIILAIHLIFLLMHHVICFFYFILYSENQCISKLDKIGIFIDMKFH